MNVAKFTRANYFEEDLRTAASGFRIQKPSEFRVSGSNIFFLHTCHKCTLSTTSESCTTFHNFSNVYKGYQSNLNMSLCLIKNLRVKLYRLMLPMLGTSSSLHKKWSFPLKIFSLLNVTESAASCGFVHIYWRRNP